MALTYTGNSDHFYYNGKDYGKQGDAWGEPMEGFTPEQAENMMAQSALHSFDDDGKDMATAATENVAVPLSSATPVSMVTKETATPETAEYAPETLEDTTTETPPPTTSTGSNPQGVQPNASVPTGTSTSTSTSTPKE